MPWTLTTRGRRPLRAPTPASNINVGIKLYLCPEVRLQPSFVDKEANGVHGITGKAIMKCDVDIRKVHYCNVVLSGGTTMYGTHPCALTVKLVRSQRRTGRAHTASSRTAT